MTEQKTTDDGVLSKRFANDFEIDRQTRDVLLRTSSRRRRRVKNTFVLFVVYTCVCVRARVIVNVFTNRTCLDRFVATVVKRGVCCTYAYALATVNDPNDWIYIVR